MSKDAEWLYKCPATGYYMECDSEEKRIYDMLLCAFMTGRSSVQYFSDIEPEDMQKLLRYIIKDRRLTVNISEKNVEYNYGWYPDYGYYYQVSVTADIMDDVHAYNKLCRLQIESIMDGIDDDWSDYEKVKYIHDWICNNTVYEKGSENCYNITGVLVDGVATCQGYSKTFNLLCELNGLEALEISGHSKGGAHMWSMVEVNEYWYNFDVTWDDTIKNTLGVSYGYFGVPQSIMAQTHEPRLTYKEWLPEGTDKYNMWYAWRQNWVVPSDIKYNDMVMFFASRLATEYKRGNFYVEFAFEDGKYNKDIVKEAIGDAHQYLLNKGYRVSRSRKTISTDTVFTVIMEGY